MKDERSTKAVDVAIAYGRGEASEMKLNKAKAAASAAAGTAWAAWSADADDAWAADAARAADDAWAAWAAAWAARAAKKENQLLTANICREVLGKEIIQKINEML